MCHEPGRVITTSPDNLSDLNSITSRLNKKYPLNFSIRYKMYRILNSEFFMDIMDNVFFIRSNILTPLPIYENRWRASSGYLV